MIGGWPSGSASCRPTCSPTSTSSSARRSSKGADLIDLGIGDPDLPTPTHIVAELQRAADEGRHHRYPSYSGMAELRSAAAAYYASRWGVKLDPAREVVVLIGSKEGIAHFPLAFVDPGDVVLVPDPGYPVYAIGTQFGGGRVHPVPLRRENGFLPDLAAIPAEVAQEAKVIWVNYPNNPTAATAPLSFYQRAGRVGARARRHHRQRQRLRRRLLRRGEAPPSILSVAGANDVAIEFYSLSKTYNMTGWRSAFACGNADAGRAGSARSRPTSTRACSRRCSGPASPRCRATSRASRGCARCTASGATCCAAGWPRPGSTC